MGFTACVYSGGGAWSGSIDHRSEETVRGKASRHPPSKRQCSLPADEQPWPSTTSQLGFLSAHLHHVTWHVPVGLALFVLGAGINYHADCTLRALRKRRGDTVRA